jgi:hypothetical protein
MNTALRGATPEPTTYILAELGEAIVLTEAEELDPYRSERVNYWYETDGLAYPVIVENGEVTALNIEWR